MSKIYSVVNQKGGVGKTTTVVNLAAYLATAKKRVLVLDMDPQGNATSGFGLNKYQIKQSIYDVLIDDLAIQKAIYTYDKLENVDIIPANPSLAGAEVELVGLMAREYRLKNAIIPLLDKYDYILMDCPPSLGLLTLNALTATRDGILIPIQCEYLSLEGLTQLLQAIKLVRKHLNPTLAIRGLILTMYDKRTTLSKQVVEEVRQHFPGKVFRAIIPRNVRLSEAPSFGQPISLYAPSSSGALAYKYLAAELIKGDKATS